MRKFAVSAAFGLALPCVLIIFWWVATAISPNFFVPSPGNLVTTFVETWFGPRLWIDILPSILRFAVGVSLAIAIGIIAGLLVGLNRGLRAFTEPIFEFFRALPAPVLIPVLLLVIGPNDVMKIAIIVLTAVWPVLLNTIEGVRATDPVQNDTSRSYGIHGLSRIRYQVLPSALPQIMTGVRQALPIGLIVMVISEMFASTEGLGFSIIQFQRAFAIPEMWSGVVVLGLFGFGVSLLFRAVERRLLRWYHGSKEIHNAA